MCICIFSPACPRGPRVSRSAHSLSSETLKGVFPECIRLVYVPISTVSGGILHVRVASCTSWIHSNLIKPPRRSLVFSLSHCLHPFSSANRSRPNFCGLAKIYAPPSTSAALHPSFEWKVISLLYYNGKSTYLPRRLHSRQQEAWHSPKLIRAHLHICLWWVFAWNTV